MYITRKIGPGHLSYSYKSSCSLSAVLQALELVQEDRPFDDRHPALEGLFLHLPVSRLLAQPRNRTEMVYTLDAELVQHWGDMEQRRIARGQNDLY